MTLPSTENRSDADAIIEAALSAAELYPLNAGATYHALVPDGARAHVVDAEHLLDAPRRAKGTTVLHDVASLAAFVNAFAATAIYADAPSATLTAVVNGSTAEGTGWGDHRATLRLRYTPEWQKWSARSGRLGSQVDFAELLEDRIIDIVDPDGATMLELAQSFEASSSGRFKSAQRLTSGERQFIYEEAVEAKAGRKGDLTVPERFTLGIAVFVGEEPIEVVCRLRYRINGGDLAIGYVIDRLDDIKRRAFDDAVESLSSLLEPGTSDALYRGEAPA